MPASIDFRIRKIAAEHQFMEGVGGVTECSCGWPTREQYEAGEPDALHVIEAVRSLIESDVVDQHG